MTSMAFAARAAFTATLLLAGQLAGAVQVVVGQVGPLSGLDANQGRAYGTGMQIYFNAVNKAGGVNGHTFTLARRDDGGRPEDTVSATRAMLAEDKPMVLAGYFGSRNVADLVASGVLEKERIALVGYRTAEVRPETPLVYNVRASLRVEPHEQELGGVVAHREGHCRRGVAAGHGRAIGAARRAPTATREGRAHREHREESMHLLSPRDGATRPSSRPPASRAAAPRRRGERCAPIHRPARRAATRAAPSAASRRRR